jgi:FkbM family methyltransferase
MRFIVEPAIGFNYLLGTPKVAPRYFEQWIRSGDTVYDVGANKGQMALVFARLVGPAGRVIALEPAANEFRSLERNVGLNSLGYVRAINAAAAQESGTVVFEYNPSYPSQGKLASVEPSYVVPGVDRITVPAIALDELLQSERAPDIIKIDVEGAAAGVLRGAQRILDAAPGIFIELHGPEEQAAVKTELVARGYIVQNMSGERVADPTGAWQNPLWCYRRRRDS